MNFILYLFIFCFYKCNLNFDLFNFETLFAMVRYTRHIKLV
jgi:hypothetical protein